MTARHDAIPEHAMDNGAYSMISAVVICERQSRDRGWWERMAACFAPDATVRLSWFKGDGRAFVEASRAMSARELPYHHR